MSDVCQTFVAGQQGAGKSTLAGFLAESAARVVACDMLRDYPWIEGVGSYHEFARTFPDLHAAGGQWSIAIRHRNPAHHLAALRLVYNAQEAAKRAGEPVRPIALLLEETGLFTGAHQLPETLQWISTTGRHFQLSYVVVVQRSTQVPPMLGTNADVVVAMQTRREDTVLRECFTKEERSRIRELVKVQDDDDLPMGERPVQGRNFLTDPPDADVYEQFREATNP